ncbi:LAFE_0A05908g1_1 [Lachancea fermentati]|uniref:U3 small nucleolar ribonucleoprotein protein MPP10 n=1 Tax=Lachancea fermentati TaxID=4955 RepID=A0A1G4M6V8_LACFM|nr:LAFE_0A05908g1_1 [Lachancea fermentati]
MADFVEILHKDPLEIISKKHATSQDALKLVKSYIDCLIISKETGSKANTILDEIVIEGLDANQVWGQARMVLEKSETEILESIANLKSEVAHFSVNGSGHTSDEDSHASVSSENDSDFSEPEQEESDNSDSETNLLQEDLEPENVSEQNVEAENEVNEEKLDTDSPSTGTANVPEVPEDKFGLNDRFFNLEKFNEQTLMQENANDVDDNDSEEIDYFADIPSDEDEDALYYEDFFDPPSIDGNEKISTQAIEQSERNTHNFDDEGIFDEAMTSAKLDLFADAASESDGENENNDVTEKLSSFQLQQAEIQRQIVELEKEAVAEKKWALKGEVKARDRPDDALLTENLEFERTSKPVPVITAEVTETLEEMIRKRIKELNFDDLPKRMLSNKLSTPKPRLEISDVKSSKSLTELYENDYNGTSDETAASEELKRAHEEISSLYGNLVYKLDALSSAHFIPKPSEKSLDIKVQGATINMEDAQPLNMSNASTLAPQEVYTVGKSKSSNEIALKSGMVLAKDELTRDNKKRLRRAMKRKKAKENENKAQFKKSRKNDVIETLSNAKNVTLIDKKGEKRDVKGNIRRNQVTNSTGLKL